MPIPSNSAWRNPAELGIWLTTKLGQGLSIVTELGSPSEPERGNPISSNNIGLGNYYAVDDSKSGKSWIG